MESDMFNFGAPKMDKSGAKKNSMTALFCSTLFSCFHSASVS